MILATYWDPNNQIKSTVKMVYNQSWGTIQKYMDGIIKCPKVRYSNNNSYTILSYNGGHSLLTTLVSKLSAMTSGQDHLQN